ncbi:tripartite motif-containing protein 16-like [Nothobranchius furzeri]|uniref:tripartite motif-containing protein 16-like n=1 Tax=Nothobranchius furzeri TaxID=105023 RepID=UPI00077D3EDB|nr:tripartite motif-containing protein 16 isoform X1 [Nothobranchius furzeri]
MAQRGAQLDHLKYSCSICLDILRDPVTIPCGHSYCMDCIKVYWDGEDHKHIHSCPQCRQIFIPRPVLVKNITLAELAEELKETGHYAAPDDVQTAGPEDVTCDICTGAKLRAVKSCLVCLVSYCEVHLQNHYDVPPLQKHKLVKPSKNLQENICPLHNEAMKIFCRTDQQSICYVCLMQDHKGHETVSAAAERAEKQKELEVSRQLIQQVIQDQEKDVKLLQQQVETISVSADQAVEDSEEIVSQLIHLIQKRSSDVKQQIRSQQEMEMSRVRVLQEKLQQEITELRRKDAELEQLSHTEDLNVFLQNLASVSALGGSTCSYSTIIHPPRDFRDVTAAVSTLRDKIQDILRGNQSNTSLTASQLGGLMSEPEPKTRAHFLEYSQGITLDPDSAYRFLMLTEGSRKAAPVQLQQFHSHHPDRFTYWWQVLSREGLIGRCYWEVELEGDGVYVAAAYRSISRAGKSNDSMFGYNDKSWSLRCASNSYTFWHNEVLTPVSGPRSSRIGVYLDHRAGVLSFYSVGKDTTLLHRVQTRFHQPLHAGISFFDYGESAEFVKLK